MLRGQGARFLVRFIILGAAAGTLAGYSARATRPALSGEAAASAPPAQPQTPNRLGKADRLPLLVSSSLTSADAAGYTLASVDPSSGDGQLYPSAFAAVPSWPSAALHPADATADAAAPPEDHPAIAAVPLPPKRPKNLVPPPQGLLNDAQIESIKGRLQLTADQAQYWPAVETALRDVVKTTLRDGRMPRTHNGKTNIDVNSPEVQRLIWAAMPLIMRLREDQKREVRKLARVIGLDSVASQI